MDSFDPLLSLDYAGVGVFAATGALAASRKQLDIIGFIFLASFTGIGGGTLRDLILGKVPVFWVINPDYILVCAVIGIIVYLFAHLLESRYKTLIWLDAVGLAAYSVMGAATGLAATGSSIVAIITGMLTATFGGILRDILSGEQSVILRPEIYVSAAMAGAASYTMGTKLDWPVLVTMLLSFCIAFLIRGGAIRYGWSLPKYKSKVGRNDHQLKRDGIFPERKQ